MLRFFLAWMTWLLLGVTGLYAASPMTGPVVSKQRMKVTGVFVLEHMQTYSGDQKMGSGDGIGSQSSKSWSKLFFAKTATGGDGRMRFPGAVDLPESISKVKGLVIDVWYAPKALRRGVEVPLMAEIFREPLEVAGTGSKQSTSWLKVHQMIAHLTGRDGHVQPVWIVSKDLRELSKGPLSFLKMHVPAFDYLTL